MRATETETVTICDLYRSGRDAIQVAALTGRSTSTVYRVLNAQGVARRIMGAGKPAVTEQEKDDICRRYSEGQSCRAIACEVGLSDTCVSNILKQRNIVLRPHGNIGAETKICTLCGQTKSVSEFNRRGENRHRSDCRECRRSSSRCYREENKPQLQVKKRTYERDNKEKRRQYGRQWAKNNRAKVLAKKSRRRARKVSAPGNFTAQQWEQLCSRYGNACLRCGESTRLTPDHIIPLSKPGATNDISNIQPLCFSCNSGKCDRVIDFRPDCSCLLRWRI